MADSDKTLVSEATLNTTRFISGSGVPNGVVTAPPGSIYTDTAKTWDVLAWIKTAGTGNTGWEVLRASATPRTILTLSTTPVAAGDVRYTRTASGVTLVIEGLKPTVDGALTMFTDQALLSIAPPGGAVAEFRLGVANTEATRRAKMDQYGVLTVYGAKATDALYGSVSFNTTKAWVAPLGTVVTS